VKDQLGIAIAAGPRAAGGLDSEHLKLAFDVAENEVPTLQSWHVRGCLLIMRIVRYDRRGPKFCRVLP